MNRSGQFELESIKHDLSRIIAELEEIAIGIGSDFEGIGNEKCASRVLRIADHYRNVKSRLNSIDTRRVADEFKRNLKGANT
ncbi:hypothetical protein [Bacillus sp. B-jedd]|uniref:hypothetical protein n=1 Tax=Bacillus sp. B-jedd TaxID=1476857 RepID=UPI0005156C8F|nr:hypothetical protein [Bacillus sp. B-jedd]CEG28524.1 hypothetical protein BN1002_03445 [Bacillus sp. B-jedd]